MKPGWIYLVGGKMGQLWEMEYVAFIRGVHIFRPLDFRDFNETPRYVETDSIAWTVEICECTDDLTYNKYHEAVSALHQKL